MEKSGWFKRYFLPGFVFQSVVIAGGYGTGRELAEFFLSQGPLGGLLAMLLVSTVLWSAVCVVSFDFARTFRAFDYRTFFKKLLGPAWPAFELCYIVLLLVVLAVIAAAAGTILAEVFALPYYAGVVGIMAAVGALVFFGSELVEKFLTVWSFLLYAVYFAFFLWCFSSFGDRISGTLAAGEVREGWFVGGVRYAAYNLGIIPAILFVTRHARSRRDSVVSGLLAGPIAILPGLLFYLAMVGQYPEILDRPVPANALLEVLGSRAFQILFQVVLFGTLIETGTGLIHAVNERIAGVFHERGTELPSGVRSAVALGLLLLGTVLARFGIIDLIARGYGTLTWAFLIVFVIPVLTVGVLKVVRATPTRSPSGPA